eukprot:GFKZ01008819.1.p1 GENE.GFKZ01008819.1~~GFKZ01008819.1.p1  ORF type:complete len:479 (+),score=39.36 GFKZ01008819.1:336-1772(+)
MVVDDPLDFTPNFTMSTLQTSSEVANLIINSVLVVLVLINIGSAVSKLVYITKPGRIWYSSWLRGFIFANSDDPLRIISWMMRRYIYRDPKYERYPNRLRLKRLLWPLLARGLVFIVSVASIAVTIPTDKMLDGCQNGDYRVVFDVTNPNPDLPRQPICSEIPLTSKLGSPLSKAVSCVCPAPLVPTESFAEDTADSRDVIFVSTSINSVSQEMVIFIATFQRSEAFQFFIEWRPEDRPNLAFRSQIDEGLTPREFSNLVTSWFLSDHDDCEPVGEDTEDGAFIFKTFSCRSQDISADGARMESRLRDSISFERVPEIQERREVFKVATSGDDLTGFPSTECVVPIIVSRPIVNMAPMAIILLIWVTINVIISLVSRRYDNALDAAFHLVKEALGHDSTSNPLEDCTEKKERKHLKLRNWQCGAGGFHRGFLGRRGDVALDEFDEFAVVSGCGIIRSEHETSRGLITAPRGFAAPQGM